MHCEWIPAFAGMTTCDIYCKLPKHRDQPMSDPNYFVYILASRKNGTLHIGVTNNLERRIWEHRQQTSKSFTSRYKVHSLVRIEGFTLIEEAIAREKALKNWRRAWKVELIEASNPDWVDLAANWFEPSTRAQSRPRLSSWRKPGPTRLCHDSRRPWGARHAGKVGFRRYGRHGAEHLPCLFLHRSALAVNTPRINFSHPAKLRQSTYGAFGALP